VPTRRSVTASALVIPVDECLVEIAVPVLAIRRVSSALFVDGFEANPESSLKIARASASETCFWKIVFRVPFAPFEFFRTKKDLL